MINKEIIVAENDPFPRLLQQVRNASPQRPSRATVPVSLRPPTAEPWAEWLRDTWVKPVFAEAKITAGRGDPEQWARSNPALGIRISSEYVAQERASLPARTFAVERLGVRRFAHVDRGVEDVVHATQRDARRRDAGPGGGLRCGGGHRCVHVADTAHHVDRTPSDCHGPGVFRLGGPGRGHLDWVSSVHQHGREFGCIAHQRFDLAFDEFWRFCHLAQHGGLGHGVAGGL